MVPTVWTATTDALCVVKVVLANLPLVANILPSLVALHIVMPVVSTPDARVSIPIGDALMVGIPSFSFSLQLKTKVDSMSIAGLALPWPKGFMLESNGFFEILLYKLAINKHLITMELSVSKQFYL